ncbi:hypothetical protein QUF72_07360 [Desulfobacterales bacterium HSG2]|nr:hypothetical protein [Desulfobacterales bacterium HSG2]
MLFLTLSGVRARAKSKSKTLIDVICGKGIMRRFNLAFTSVAGTSP